MLKWLMIILMTAGVFIISISVYQIYNGNVEVAHALEEAQSIVKQEVDEKDDTNSIEAKELSSEDGEVIGIISIPRLEKELPIIQGTEDEQLERGVGHFTGSKYPGQGRQVVLSGHRDTVFTGLGDLEEDDEIIIKMDYGTYTYYLQETYIVDKDDLTVIDSTIDEEILTLTTCYPFSYFGDAPDRYIIEAVRK
ncbi:class D sortase [Salipaludibacillus sp. HK11]|uniref:class D sortase n=1 Tax=Salipaludibacillus sp. HK11 TaxID=3394320 RepID=UPI0039FBDBD6